MNDVILEANHLTKIFLNHKHRISAVNDVSFSIRRGEIIGIAGISGSGKSTLARLAAGLETPDQGQVIYEDACMYNQKKGKRYSGKIQMVFQSPYESFDPHRTLGFSIKESLVNRGIPKKNIQDSISQLLKECLLPEEYSRKYPDEVSGGECQRAAIARALSSDPEILICDEAVSSLDGPAAQQILQLCRKLNKERNLSIIFISHNIAMMQGLCNRLLFMHEGKIVEEGKTNEILFHPSSKYAKDLIAASMVD